MIPSEAVDDLNRRRELRDALWLALVPLGVAFVLGVLLLPRRAAPESVPLPVADARALARIVAADHALAERARREPLPGAVRALGSAIRDFHTLEARDADGRELYDGPPRRRRRRSSTRCAAEPSPCSSCAPCSSRGSSTRCTASRRRASSRPSWRRSPAASCGRSRSRAGARATRSRRTTPRCARCSSRCGTAFLGLRTANAELAPTLDEQRALYAFYLSHAHPPKAMRDALDAARRGARDATACAAIDEAERGAAEAWRLERIARLAAIDPDYPADYARGVASYRRGDFGASARAFRAWLRDHPDGPARASRPELPAGGVRRRARGVSPMRALLVDDDRELARLLADYLGPHGVALDHVEDGALALERLAGSGRAYDIVLLDVMLPGIDGFEVCRRIRARYDVPIVMLTARGEDTDRVVGLELGADDYVPKPFNPRELLARMRAVLRRARPRRGARRAGGDRVEVGDLVVDVPAHKATLAGKELQLTSFEFRVLVALARRAGETVTREELAERRPAQGGPLRPERGSLARRPRLAPAPQARRRRPRAQAHPHRARRRLRALRPS